jgi:hypothetical protein
MVWEILLVWNIFVFPNGKAWLKEGHDEGFPHCAAGFLSFLEDPNGVIQLGAHEINIRPIR